ncbi:2572_t:CDS:2 [Funneliformis caledonium]|uniref:2572_t:CDS:1 n=1 Tax=Funneliformis caledonium TaxID=1117310 RepID=A0A9N9FUN8_9GLOM|nr:2572_t:CDS:2 [Funneliformis caledonium]
MSMSNYNMNDKENKAPHSRDADKKRKVAEEAHETRLAYDRNNKNNKRRKIAEKTHEELETRLVAEEEAQRACAHKKYLLRKSRETPQ